MDRQVPEAGALRVFQLFAGVQLGLLSIAAVSQLAGPDPRKYHSAVQLAFMLAATATLFGYLLVPGARRLLGRGYLPVAIGLSLCAPLLGQGLLVLEHHPFGEYLSVTTETALFSLFPLLAAGWRYRFRVVAGLAVGFGTADHVLTRLAYPASAQGVEYGRIVLTRTLGYLVVGFVLSRLMRQQRAQYAALQRANANLAHYAATLEQLAVSRERERLARELHDTIAHTLSGVAVQLEGVRSLLARPGEPPTRESPTRESPTLKPPTLEPPTRESPARDLLDQALDTARAGLIETRRALRDLRATAIEELGLGQALRRCAERAAARCGAALDLELPDRPPPLPPDLEQGLYRIAQEALENVVGHAAAGRIEVRLRSLDGRVRLAVRDDGRGFDPSAGVAGDHFGLRGMRERAELLGGELTVTSEPGAGTGITLVVPYGTAPEEVAVHDPGAAL